MLPDVSEHLESLCGKTFTLSCCKGDSTSADLCKIVSTQKFMACESLADQHCLLCPAPEDAADVIEHYKKLKLLSPQSTSACIVMRVNRKRLMSLVSDMPVLHRYQPGTRFLMAADADGMRRQLPPCDWDVVVYYDSPTRQELSFNNLGTDILTIKAGIGRTSIRLLLDSGASKCFISRKRAIQLGLIIRPYNQDLVVITGDGSESAVTGYTTAQVHIGQFKAKVTFLVTELAPSFDAVLGYEWLKSHCDLQLTSNKLVFKNGSKVTTLRLPKLSSYGPTDTFRQQRTSTAAADSASTADAPAQPAYLSAMQVKRAVRKKCAAFLVTLKDITKDKPLETKEDVSTVVDQLLAVSMLMCLRTQPVFRLRGLLLMSSRLRARC